MRDDGDLASLATRRLSPAGLEQLRESLRTAFAGEVAERLPRLTSAVADRDPGRLREAVRDAHALGSSAAVLGEPVASARARAAERHLAGLQDAVPPTSEPQAWAAASAEVGALREALAGWLA